MSATRVSPHRAAELIETEGYIYLDVRSVQEFKQGHPTGAYNIPIADIDPRRGMVPNRNFVAQVKASFAVDQKIVLGCRSGGRSMQALGMLAQSGFSELVDSRAGFVGAGAEDGWDPSGLPTSTTAETGRSWEELKA